MPESFEGHQEWYYSSLKLAADSAEFLYTYNSVIHGFSTRLTAEEVKALEKQPGILSLVPETRYELHTTRTPEFLGLGKTDQLLVPASASQGEVIIGLIDTGVWPELKSFDDTGLGPVPRTWKGECEVGTNFKSSDCNKKLIGARFFCKGYEALLGPIDESIESKSPRDDDGHGTHTATTAAGSPTTNASLFGYASGTARGMAPHARIAVYKGCWLGGCFTSDILAAMEKAIDDGVNILSMSIGGGMSDYYRDTVSVGAFTAMRKGILVSCSGGNAGPSSGTLSNVAPWITTVGAGTLDRDFPAYVILGNGKNLTGTSLYSANTDTYGEELVADAHLLPAASVGQKEGDNIKKYIESNDSPTATIGFSGTELGIQPSPVVASFSSRGPNLLTPEILKPDLIAPGVNILAGWTGKVGPTGLESDTRHVNFNIISGTSMSCPHVSGLAALVKAAHPEWSPAAIKSALMTTAYTAYKRLPSTPFDHGAGHVDPIEALDPGLVYDITVNDYIDFLCALNYSSDEIKHTTAQAYNCSSSKTYSIGDLNYPSFSINLETASENGDSKTTSTFKYTRILTNVGKPATYKASVSPHTSSVKVAVEPESLTFNTKDEKKRFIVTVSADSMPSGTASFAQLTWSDGKHTVTSPITFTWT
ncbi:Subtilisin-like protease SBT1.7 [Bienertia sinuspersici]